MKRRKRREEQPSADESPTSPEELALERWEDDGGRIGPHPGDVSPWSRADRPSRRRREPRPDRGRETDSSLSVRAFILVLLVTTLGTAWLARSQERAAAERAELIEGLRRATGLDFVFVSGEDFAKGVEPEGFLERTGASYRPSYNESPNVPEQCWIETGYGTQNACKYCHTD